MKLFRSLFKPEFVFRPRQIGRRILFEFSKDKRMYTSIRLPWGLMINVDPGETIGSCIARQGVYELAVSELLWRLCDQGELAVDVGANVGHMTALLGFRVGQKGRLISLEPHPDIFPVLEENVHQWRQSGCVGEIITIRAAISDRAGETSLYAPTNFKDNHGTASLEKNVGEIMESYPVMTTTLDALLGDTNVGVLKIDVEGHELGVIRGARKLCRMKMIRDIVFEEHRLPPTDVTDSLQGLGYDIFYIKKNLFGIRLVPIQDRFIPPWGEPPSYLATLNTDRVQERLKPLGYQVLGN